MERAATHSCSYCRCGRVLKLTVIGCLRWGNMQTVSQWTFRIPAKIDHHGDGGRLLRFVGVRAPVLAIWRAANPFKRTSCARVRGEYGQYPRRIGRGHHPQFCVYYRGGVHSFRGEPGDNSFLDWTWLIGCYGCIDWQEHQLVEPLWLNNWTMQSDRESQDQCGQVTLGAHKLNIYAAFLCLASTMATGNMTTART